MGAYEQALRDHDKALVERFTGEKKEFLPVPTLCFGPPLYIAIGEKPQVTHCAELRGHILKIKDSQTIVCTRCPAEWRSH
jgi:hypothetical protein